MNFTFGIITYAEGEQHDMSWRDRMRCICDSIRKQNIPEYEIIICGGPFVSEGRHSLSLHNKPDTVHIRFDENSTPNKTRFNLEGNNVGSFYKENNIKSTGWISKKKNHIIKISKYENIVFMHDYVALMHGWYEGQLKHKNENGDNWDLQMNVVQDIWGERSRDWVSWDNPKYGQRVFMPYEDQSEDATRHSYISGSYWIGKKRFMEENLLNEDCVWGSCDDIEWSMRVREKAKYVMNSYSVVRYVRPKYIGEEPLDRPRLGLYP